MLKKNILFVDDERQILSSLRRLFMLSEYNTYFADNGFDALEILKNNKINLLITDMRMPGMDGYELLEATKNLYPDTLRLILSGYTNEMQTFKAVQNNLARIYMVKPWENDKLIKIIDQMLYFEDNRNDSSILNIVNRINALPTLPHTYNQICKLIDEDAVIEDIAKVIEVDQSISAKILQVVNSSFYSIKVGSVKQAISYLGINNVKIIVLVNSLFNINEHNNLFSLDLLWKHASTTNNILHLIYSKLLNKKISEQFSMAGLLHDIGKIIEIQYFKDEYIKILSLIKNNDDISPVDAEKQILNTTHAEIGGYLLDYWEVPHAVVETSLYHHKPLDDKVVNKELVCAVHIANNYSCKLLNDSRHIDLQQDTFDYLGITQESCDNLLEEFAAKWKASE